MMALTVALGVFVFLSRLHGRPWEAAVLAVAVTLTVFVILAGVRLTHAPSSGSSLTRSMTPGVIVLKEDTSCVVCSSPSR